MTDLILVFLAGAMCGGLGAAAGLWIVRHDDRAQINHFCQEAYRATQEMRNLIDIGRKELLPLIEAQKVKP